MTLRLALRTVEDYMFLDEEERASLDDKYGENYWIMFVTF
jgi:hypothetical protein